jgi:hypothetical protein
MDWYDQFPPEAPTPCDATAPAPSHGQTGLGVLAGDRSAANRSDRLLLRTRLQRPRHLAMQSGAAACSPTPESSHTGLGGRLPAISTWSTLSPDSPRDAPDRWRLAGRSISTAYYAVFHLITGDSTALVYVDAHASRVAHRLRRSLNHADLKKVFASLLGSVEFDHKKSSGLGLISMSPPAPAGPSGNIHWAPEGP